MGPGPFRLFSGYFEALTTPDPLYPLVVHVPAFGTQQGRDPPIAVAPILAGQIDDCLGQRVFIVTLNKYASLCCSRLPQYSTGSAFRHAQLSLSVPNHPSTSFGA